MGRLATRLATLEWDNEHKVCFANRKAIREKRTVAD